jgi:hypothetical protein
MDRNLEQYKFNALEKFRKWSTYRDELPQEKLRPNHPDYDRYKCRINFISGMNLTISLLLQH